MSQIFFQFHFFMGHFPGMKDSTMSSEPKEVQETPARCRQLAPNCSGLHQLALKK
jgi:hypothetical protein